jgi:hypothetical protein
MGLPPSGNYEGERLTDIPTEMRRNAERALRAGSQAGEIECNGCCGQVMLSLVCSPCCCPFSCFRLCTSMCADPMRMKCCTRDKYGEGFACIGPECFFEGYGHKEYTLDQDGGSGCTPRNLDFLNVFVCSLYTGIICGLGALAITTGG